MLHDINLATSFLFLNMAIKVLELDKRHVQIGDFKIKTPYVKLINNLISKAINERRRLKQIMYKKNIQVNFLYREGEFIHYEFILNKTKVVKCYFSPVIKKEVEKILVSLMRVE